MLSSLGFAATCSGAHGATWHPRPQAQRCLQLPSFHSGIRSASTKPHSECTLWVLRCHSWAFPLELTLPSPSAFIPSPFARRSSPASQHRGLNSIKRIWFRACKTQDEQIPSPALAGILCLRPTSQGRLRKEERKKKPIHHLLL